MRGPNVLRRMLDITLATVLLVLVSPALIFGALLVLVTSGRPIFFPHQRLGQYGRPFNCWKLRSMRVGAEESLREDDALLHRHKSNGFKLDDAEDPRVTAAGRWLRRRYIDEIPQLFNVLNGTMSMVGPRPVVAEELERFAPHDQELLEVRPGIIGAWTSLGVRRPAYPQRAGLEIEYVRRRTVLSDLRILLKSVPVFLRGSGR